MKKPLINYHDYLRLDQILTAQQRRSEEFGRPAHDENLFIVIHQVYELWFKQILTEVDSVIAIFAQNRIEESEMGWVTHRLERVNKIFELLIQQISVLETMTPLDFLDFRDLLYPASGFQSAQFRVIENRLGLLPNQRLAYNAESYEKSLKKNQQSDVKQTESDQTLFESVNRWLARTPLLHFSGFDFWQEYQKAIEQMNQEAVTEVDRNPHLSDEDRIKARAQIESTQQMFTSFFNKTEFEAQRSAGQWRLQFESVLGALLILIYRDEPLFQMPHQILNALIEIDEQMASWRYRHALMARRMLGAKVGTGGSSGFQYLSQTADQHRIFKDFNQLTTFLIPRSKLPKLPDQVKKSIGYQF